MKHLNFKVLLALVAGLFLFSCCSNEDDIINNVNAESSLNAEEAAFQDLLVKLEALNGEYGVTPQTRVIGGDSNTWLGKTFVVIIKGVLGGTTAFDRTLYERIVGACAASVKAMPLVEAIHPHLDEWRENKLSELYLSRIGSTASEFDEAGNVHNMVIGMLYNLYILKENRLFNMADVELGSVITQQMGQLRYSTPPDYNPIVRPLINFTQVNNIIKTNDYTQLLQSYMLNHLITNYEYNTLISFIKGLSSVTETNVLDYCVNFRSFVYNSGISSISKSNICSLVSIGFASAHLWRTCRIHLSE